MMRTAITCWDQMIWDWPSACAVPEVTTANIIRQVFVSVDITAPHVLVEGV